MNTFSRKEAVSADIDWLIELQWCGEVGMLLVLRLVTLFGDSTGPQNSHLPGSVSELTSMWLMDENLWDLLTQKLKLTSAPWASRKFPCLVVNISTCWCLYQCIFDLRLEHHKFCKIMKLHVIASTVEQGIWSDINLCSRVVVTQMDLG